MEERTILSIYGGILSMVTVRATWSVLGSVPVLISKLRYVVDTHLTRIFALGYVEAEVERVPQRVVVRRGLS